MQQQVKCLGAMLFEPTDIFVQLITFKTPSPIFVLSYLSKEKLIGILINARKISSCKVLSNAVVNVPSSCRELWKQLISVNFYGGIFEIITITVTKIVLSQVLVLPLLLNKIKTKARNTMASSHHSKISSTENQAVPFFCCSWIMELSNISLWLSKVKVFPNILAYQS